jgi:Ser/Thr protein kinase RdoA (MazF antagonist)
MNTELSQTIIQQMLTTTPPAFSDADAVDIADRYFGIKASIQRLVIERDQNFRLTAEDGRRFVLKISNQAEQLEVVDFQNQALLHVAKKDASLPVPGVIPTLDGQLHNQARHAGEKHYVRVLSWEYRTY